MAVALLPAARAQEEPEPPPQYEYALDDLTELTLTSHPKDSKVWTADLRLLGEPAQGQIFSFSGEIRQVGRDVYEYKPGNGPNQKSVRVAGKPGEKSPLEVSARNFTDDFTKPVHIRGTFKPLLPAEREARMKKRFEAADAAFNDLYTHMLTDAGKSGEPKLKQVKIERIYLRDEAAGGPDAEPAGLPYWTAMWSATLENIGFLRSYTGRNAPKGFPGSYRMANGNALEVEALADAGQVKFTVTVRHSADEKPGVLTGTARLAGSRVNYKESLSKEEARGRQPVEAVLTQRGHVIHVEAKNTSELSGAGVSFDGEYYKVAPRK
jgi:hypothetical protein